MGVAGRLGVCVSLTAMAITGSCRSPADFCTGDCSTGGIGSASAQGGTGPSAGASNEAGAGAEPTTTLQGGTGGATARPTSGGFGGKSDVAGAPNEAGSGGEPPTTRECTSDADCSDGKACNGAEICRGERCEAGSAFTCPNISECFEGPSGAACRYSANDRFVVYSGDEFGVRWANAVAVPITRLEKPVRLNFSQGVMDEEFGSIFEYDWSPDGRRLIFPTSTSDLENDIWDQKFFWLDITGPLDAKPRRIPNVPINDSFRVITWSPASNAVVIGYDDEKYAVRFSASGAETALVRSPGRIQPCADERTVAYATKDGTRLATVWDAPNDSIELPANLISRSPDGRWLLLSDERHAYLARCNLDSTLEELGGPAGVVSSWSPNSEYVVYSDTDADSSEDPTPKKLSAFRVETSAQHAALFEAISADPTVKFEPGSTRFLYVEQTPKDELLFRLVDLAKPSSGVVLPIPAGVGDPSANDIVWYTWWLGTTGRLSYDVEGENATYVIEATANAKPRLVEANGEDLRFSEDGTRAIWIESGGASAGALSQAYTLDLTRNDSQAHALFAKPLTGSLSIYEPRIIRRFIQDPTIRHELFVVPPDFEGEPVRVNNGRMAAEPTLQPRP